MPTLLRMQILSFQARGHLMNRHHGHSMWVQDDHSPQTRAPELPSRLRFEIFPTSGARGPGGIGRFRQVLDPRATLHGYDGVCALGLHLAVTFTVDTRSWLSVRMGHIEKGQTRIGL